MGLERGIRTSVKYAKGRFEDVVGITAFNKRLQEEERDPESVINNSAVIYAGGHLVGSILVPLTEMRAPARPVGYNPQALFEKSTPTSTARDIESRRYAREVFSLKSLDSMLIDIYVLAGLTLLLNKVVENPYVAMAAAKAIHNTSVFVGADLIKKVRKRTSTSKNKPAAT